MEKSYKPIPKHLNNYLDWIDVEKGLSSQTQETYSRYLKRFIEWLEEKNLSDLKPHQLDPDHIWKYRIYLARQTTSKNSNQTLSRSTQKSYLTALRSLMSYFASRDIEALPPEKIELPKDQGSDSPQFLTTDQLERLFEVPDTSSKIGLRNRAILETLFSTGMRVSELVDLDRDQIEPSLEQESLELGIVGKGNKARTVYFSNKALKWLKKYLETRNDDADALFVNYRKRSDASRRLTTRSIEKIVKNTAIEAGLPSNTTPHVLRHSFATNLLNQGVDLRVVQEFLGHESITATQIYTHVTSKKLKDIHKEFHENNNQESATNN
ncbi:MAG: tyrosine-type recombinase/integrase [Candidatus Magasanikbacteria bacterium]